MPSKRLFIGNLSRETQRSDLESTLTNIISKDDRFHSIEIRQKNEATFAFVDIEFGDEGRLGKYLADLNNSSVKGQTLKVQLAKENFMERLKKEREGLRPPPQRPGPEPERRTWRDNQSRNFNPPRPNTNYDFEIVSIKKPAPESKPKNETDDEKRPQKKKAKLVVQKKSDSEDDSSEDELEKGGIPMFRGLGFYPGLLQSNSNQETRIGGEGESGRYSKTTVPPPPPIVLDKIAQKMLAIANNKIPPKEPPPGPPQRMLPFKNPPNPPEFQQQEQQQQPARLLTAGGLKLNPRKKEQSDKLRIESFDKRNQNQVERNRSNLIRNALSNNALIRAEEASSGITSSKKSKNNSGSGTKSSDFLFGNEDEEDKSEDYTIKIKPQYEGKVGQKMLELNANFAWDKRFQIDERFAEEVDKEDVLNPDDEKNAQLDILGSMFGKTFEKNKKKKDSGKLGVEEEEADNSGLTTRYDPSREAHRRVFEVKSRSMSSKEDQGQDIGDEPEVEDKKEKEPEVKAPPEKSTFKVAPNLKNLFSSENEGRSGGGGFSLLSTFGGFQTPASAENQEISEKGDNATGTRSFWNKNPFKYDSSDDEEGQGQGQGEDGKKKSKKVTTKTDGKRRNYFKEDLFKRDSFFFHENDERLVNVFEEFIKSEEDLEQVRQKFNDVGRSELKLIAKSKWKNSKRKNEKRVKVMRLIRRKKRREKKQKEMRKGENPKVNKK